MLPLIMTNLNENTPLYLTFITIHPRMLLNTLAYYETLP